MLPKEPIIGFVEWEPAREVEVLVIRWEEGVEIRRALDIDERVFSQDRSSERALRVRSEDLQLAGFAGFEARYMKTPEEEFDLRFSFEIHFKDGHVEWVELVTRVIRPILDVEDHVGEVVIRGGVGNPEAISVKIVNRGSVDIPDKKVGLSVNVIAKKPLRVEVSRDSELPKPLFHESEVSPAHMLRIFGLGSAKLEMLLRYTDRLGNVYEKKWGIRLVVKKRTKKEVPLYNAFAPSSSPVVVAG